MSGPYSLRDAFETPQGYKPLVCADPENCKELHNDPDPNTDEQHHYGCECGWCQFVYYMLKH